MNKVFIFFVFSIFANIASAAYHATGPIKAEDCYDFGIKVCTTMTVTEVVSNGQRYEISKSYKDVSSYRNGNCSINTKSTGLGALSWGINAIKQPEFWGFNPDGKFVKIDAERIYFKCIKD